MSFKLLGMIIARAIIDERLIDLPLNCVFWDLILENSIHLEDLMKLDKQLAQTMLNLQELLNKRKEIEIDRNLVPQQKKELISRLCFKVYCFVFLFIINN